MRSFRWSWALALAALAGTGCSEPTNAQRCADLNDYLAGAETALQTECAVDTDCRVVWVRPDRPMAASADPSALALDRVLAEYESECESIPRATGALAAVCQPQLEDRFVEGANREVITGRRCVLRGSFTIPDQPVVDGSGDGSGDAQPPCTCETSADCPAALCIACECYDVDPCATACEHAFVCGQLDAMGLGVDGTGCIGNCQAAVEGSPAMAAFAACVAQEPCPSIRDCLELLPR